VPQRIRHFYILKIQSSFPDATVIDEKGEVKNIEFKLYAYYHSEPAATIQINAITSYAGMTIYRKTMN